MKKENDCVFCKIANKEIPVEILFEDRDIIIFPDKNPSAPIHHLVIPKKHIQSLAHLEKGDEKVIAKIFFAAKDDAKKAGLKGFKTLFNVGPDGGQIINHLHLHILGGWSKKSDIDMMPHPNLDK